MTKTTEITPRERAQAVLSQEIAKQPDTDHGIMHAYWCALERLIDDRDSNACHVIARMAGRAFGDFKEQQMLGEITDHDL